MMKRITWALILLMIIAVSGSAFASSKMRVAVIDFQNNASGPTPVTDAVRRAITDMFITELYKTHMYSIVERSRIRAIAREQRLSASGLVDSSTAVRLGKLLGVQAIITGSITQFTFKQRGGVLPIPGIGGIAIGEKKAYVTLDVRMINVETGEIMLVARETGVASHSVGGIAFKGAVYAQNEVQGILAAATHNCIKKIVKKFYIRGHGGALRVIRGGSTIVYINIGYSTGEVEKGDYFAVYQEGAPIRDVNGAILGVEKVYIGIIRVTKPFAGYSICEVVKGGPLRKGDKVAPVSKEDIKDIKISSRRMGEIAKLTKKLVEKEKKGNKTISSSIPTRPKNSIANTSDSIKVIDYFPVPFEVKENLKRIHKSWWYNYSHRRYVRSIKVLKEAIKLYKGDYLAYYWIGEVYYEIGDRRKAIEYWKKGHEINPDYVPINRKLQKVGVK